MVRNSLDRKMGIINLLLRLVGSILHFCDDEPTNSKLTGIILK